MTDFKLVIIAWHSVAVAKLGERPVYMMFEFQLSPIEKVHPWGETQDKHIHWFALTQGDYRLRVGSEYLLNYSEEYRNYCIQTLPAYQINNTTFVDYYVVRFWEDLMDILPNLLEPVPKELRPFLDSDYQAHSDTLYEKVIAWQEAEINKRVDKIDAWETAEFTNETWEIAEYATNWLSNRKLNCGYLIAAPEVWLWSDENDVILNWDNRKFEIEGIKIWSASYGNYRINRNDFINEVREFDKKLISEMNERVETICQTWKNPEVAINFEQLKSEQKNRATWMEPWLKSNSKTDWDKVNSAINLINE